MNFVNSLMGNYSIMFSIRNNSFSLMFFLLCQTIVLEDSNIIYICSYMINLMQNNIEEKSIKKIKSFGKEYKNEMKI